MTYPTTAIEWADMLCDTANDLDGFIHMDRGLPGDPPCGECAIFAAYRDWRASQ